MTDSTTTTDSSGVTYYTTNTWNLARSIASDCITAIESQHEAGDECRDVDEERYTEIERERGVWPFSGIDDMLGLMDEATDLEADTIDTDEVAIAVSTRVKESDSYEYVHYPDSHPAFESNTSENSAQTEENTPNDKQESAVENKNENEGATSGEERKDSNSEEASTDNTVEKNSVVETVSVEEINNGRQRSPSSAISAENGSKDAEEQREQPTTENTSDAIQKATSEIPEEYLDIATKFFACFVDHDENTSYSQIAKEYDTPFPSRSVAHIETINSRGENREEKVSDLAQWVEWWFDSPERLDEINNTLTPMGM